MFIRGYYRRAISTTCVKIPKYPTLQSASILGKAKPDVSCMCVYILCIAARALMSSKPGGTRRLWDFHQVCKWRRKLLFLYNRHYLDIDIGPAAVCAMIITYCRFSEHALIPPARLVCLFLSWWSSALCNVHIRPKISQNLFKSNAKTNIIQKYLASSV